MMWLVLGEQSSREKLYEVPVSLQLDTLVVHGGLLAVIHAQVAAMMAWEIVCITSQIS
jgi:hypothetical protein